MCLIQKTDLILNWSSNVHQIINKNCIRRQEVFPVDILYHATYICIHLLKLFFQWTQTNLIILEVKFI